MKLNVTALLTMSAFLCASAVGLQAEQPSSQHSIEEVIRRFTEAETQNKIARNNYTFTQDIDIMTLGQAGSITGRMRRTSDIVFDDRSNRIERITFFPPSSLTEVSLTQEDMQDLAGVQPFALTSDDLPRYQVDYVGKEKIDELTTYVFNVKPKQFLKGERYLQGKIWVDDHDLQIVKVAGQAVPELNNQKFPRFESYRENIDGRYWFPTYVYADDLLEFKKGPSVHLRVVVRYTNYRKFSGRIKLADEGEPAADEDVKATESKKPVPVKPPEPPNL
ncbi:MAG: hypothetical protein WAU45_08970 [Blastocatellia bacterium]